MSLLNGGKTKKDKKKAALLASKSSFILNKSDGGKANTKATGNAGKHVGGAQRGA